MTGAAGRPRILVDVSTLFSDGGEVPRPLARAGVALERLRTLGEPIVLVGAELGGRPLPEDEGERLAWVRASLDAPDLVLVPFEGGWAGRPTDPKAEHAVQRWVDLRSTWDADTLLTTLESSVGAARHAGLRVIRIGARGSSEDPTLPRADYEAFELLDAVLHLLVADTFDSPAGEPQLASVGSGASGPRRQAGPAGSDVLEGGQPGDG